MNDNNLIHLKTLDLTIPCFYVFQKLIERKNGFRIFNPMPLHDSLNMRLVWFNEAIEIQGPFHCLWKIKQRFWEEWKLIMDITYFNANMNRLTSFWHQDEDSMGAFAKDKHQLRISDMKKQTDVKQQ